MSDNERAVEAAAALHKVCPACNARYGSDVGFCSRDGTPLVVDPTAGRQDLVGKVLADRYRIVRLLGEGGMGQVYEAQHVNINKRFAVKLLRPEIVSNPEAVARFRQEAWSASSIGHENIVEIDDFSTLPDGSVYLTMEYLKGMALSERMRTPPRLALDEALSILLQVCRGLEAAHEKGIVHRDMKPENVFLAEKHGRVVVKILDFGIAKVSGAEGSSQSLTRTGTIFGTPHYMSPEQALGRALDHRSDVYSVGVIMYEAFTGKVPFEAESFMGILTKHITATPEAPRHIAPDRGIPEEVEAVILKAMAKELPDRYASMTDLVDALVMLAEQFAPHVLVPHSGTISTPRMSIAASSGPLRVSTPSAPLAVLGESASRPVTRPSGSTAPVSGAVVTTGELGEEELAAVRPGRAGVYIGLGFALLGIGAASAYVLSRPKTVTPAAATPVVETPKPPVPVDSPPVVAASIEVLVDSDPIGAKVMRGTESLGDAPLNVILTDGKSDTLVLSKPGFVDKAITVDHASGKRVIVHLEKVPSNKLPVPTHGLKVERTAANKVPIAAVKTIVSPTPAPTTTVKVPTTRPPLVSPPPINSSATTTRPGNQRRNKDPYERVDQPKKGSDVIIDPYSR